jgi:lipopolysaccharide transport system permease protein
MSYLCYIRPGTWARGLLSKGIFFMRSTFKNLYKRRHLLKVLITSAVKRQNKNNVLGYIWWLLDPLLFLAVYYLVVAVVFKRGGANQPFILFLLCGLLPFKFFSQSATQSVTSLSRAEPMIKSISFPKMVLPLSVVFTNFVYFFCGMAVAVFAAVLYGNRFQTWPNWNYIYLPVVMAVMIMFTTGLSIIVSVLSIFFADLKNILTHILKAWYFASPGLYSLDRLPDKIRPYAILNPLAGIMNGYREIIMHNHHPFHRDLLYAFLISAVLMTFGYIIFIKLESRLVKYL